MDSWTLLVGKGVYMISLLLFVSQFILVWVRVVKHPNAATGKQVGIYEWQSTGIK